MITHAPLPAKAFLQNIDAALFTTLWLDIRASKFTQLTSTAANSAFLPDTLITSRYTAAMCLLANTLPTLEGWCWRALFLDPLPKWDNILWLPLLQIKQLATKFRLRRSGRYNLWHLPMGLIHLESNDHGEWGLNDILALPDWLLIGGTFMEDGLKKGYSREFLAQFSYYRKDADPDSPRSSIHSSSSGSSDRLSITSSTGAPRTSTTGDSGSSPAPEHRVHIMSILSEHRATYRENLVAIRDYFRDNDTVDLTRFDMELIARAVNGYCYSACAATSKRFIQDILGVLDRADTMQTFIRVLENENNKSKPVPISIPKKFYVDIEHISRYHFDNCAEMSTEDVAAMLNKLYTLKSSIQRDNADNIQQAVEDVVTLVWNHESPVQMALAYDLVKELKIDPGLFKNRIYRILDITRWNTYEDAKAEEERIKARQMHDSINRKRKTGSLLTAEETAFLSPGIKGVKKL